MKNVAGIIVTSFVALQLFFVTSYLQAQPMTSHKKSSSEPSVSFNDKGDLVIKPSATSSEKDFDFYVGKWKIHNRKLKTRLNNDNEWVEFETRCEMRKILAGFGNTDNFLLQTIDGKPYEGMTLRIFNKDTKLWSIYWSDSNIGILDIPVVGSFEGNLGKFYSKDLFNGKPIIILYQWDRTNPDRPIWSQAFSPDNGKTWEWNWHMYFSKDDNLKKEKSGDTGANVKIGVIELRNYLLKPGTRDQFLDYFEEHLVSTQREQGGIPLGQFKVKGEEDNFFWIRGFEDMHTRSRFLPAFYYGEVWRKHRATANGMMLNTDNVHLLRPMELHGDKLIPAEPVNISVFKNQKGIAVIDYYIANDRLKDLMKIFAVDYFPLLKKAGIDDISFWVSELSVNDFPALPVFQDKNLLVSITYYKDEQDYASKQKQLNTLISNELKTQLLETVTTKHTVVLFPSEKSKVL